MKQKAKENQTAFQTIEIKAFGKFELPVIAKANSIGYDLAVPKDIYVPAHSRIAIPLNFGLNLPLHIEAKIEPRSGFALKGFEGYGTRKTWYLKWGFLPWIKTESGKMRFDADVIQGKVDPNYTDNIHVILKNNDVGFLIKAGTRIAQLTFYRANFYNFRLVKELSCKSRGGGFESSGTHALPPQKPNKEL